MSSQGGGPPRVADGRISHSLTAGEPRVIALGLTTLTHAFFQQLNFGIMYLLSINNQDQPETVRQ